MSAILFFEQKRVSWFRQRNFMREFLLDLFRKEKTGVEQIQFVFMSDDELLEINRQFLNHDYYTDIITFDLTDKGFRAGRPDNSSSNAKFPKTSDIYISIDRVVDNAHSLGVAKTEELRRVMIHGCLHLCGYKDKLKADQAKMRAKEDHYLQVYSKRST